MSSSPKSPRSSSSTCSYYAVSVPIGTDIPEPLAVFTSLEEAQKAVKERKGSRFKEFTSLNEAREFAMRHIENSSDQQPNSNLEAAFVSHHKAPSTKELVLFRRAIEAGNLQFIRSCVMDNPRFLISNGDCAVVLMEGPRYNAAHISAKANRCEILSFILTTVSDVSFIKSYYLKDSDETAKERANVLLCSYLNTPDKGACDTPLHFASKFASVDCVRLLLSYRQCVLNQANKLGMTPAQVICDRKRDEAEKKKQLETLFESIYYIPIMRTDDSVKVGPPQEKVDSPDVKAVAGPLSPQLAQEMYKFLKSPDRKSPFAHIRLTDSQKGVEKMARAKCRQMNVGWAENWPFLNCDVDLATKRGLDLLESHFKKVAQELTNGQNYHHLADELCRSFNDSLFISPPNPPVSQLRLRSPSLPVQLRPQEAQSKSSPPFTHNKTSSTTPTTTQTTIKSTSDSRSPADESGDEMSSGDELFHTAPSSPVNEVDPLTQVEYFVQGNKCTLWDFSAFDALVDCDLLSPQTYPLTHGWFIRIQSLPRKGPKNLQQIFNQTL